MRVTDVDIDWMEHAACNGLDPELFFPARGDIRTMNEAQKVCASCPVRLPCLEYALTVPVTNTGTYVIGVWGGSSERERARIRKRRAKTSRRYPVTHGTLRGYRHHLELGEKPCWWCQDIADRHSEGRTYGKKAPA